MLLTDTILKYKVSSEIPLETAAEIFEFFSYKFLLNGSGYNFRNLKLDYKIFLWQNRTWYLQHTSRHPQPMGCSGRQCHAYLMTGTKTSIMVFTMQLFRIIFNCSTESSANFFVKTPISHFCTMQMKKRPYFPEPIGPCEDIYLLYNGGDIGQRNYVLSFNSCVSDIRLVLCS